MHRCRSILIAGFRPLESYLLSLVHATTKHGIHDVIVYTLQKNQDQSLRKVSKTKFLKWNHYTICSTPKARSSLKLWLAWFQAGFTFGQPWQNPVSWKSPPPCCCTSEQMVFSQIKKEFKGQAPFDHEKNEESEKKC